MSQPNSICNLQADLISEILCRLPIKTIIQCKCVCKNWQKLMSDSEFVKFHLSRSPTSIIINQVHSLDPEIDNTFSILDLGHDHLCFDSMMKFDHTLIDFEVFLLGSHNGLVLLNSIYECDLYICNPIRREYITLPRDEAVQEYYNSASAFGFGYCSINGMYKVVRIDQDKNIDRDKWPVTRCSVHTLGERGWRTVESVVLRFGVEPVVGVQLAGILHWYAYDQRGQYRICSFDLEHESFQLLPPPPPPPPTSVDNIWSTLGVVRGCLCLSKRNQDFVLELWVMKEYGVKESWTKEIVINVPDYWLSYLVIYPITVLRDGEILFLGDDYTFFSANHDEKTIKVYEDHDIFQVDFEAMAHVSSFLSLEFCKAEVKKF